MWLIPVIDEPTQAPPSGPTYTIVQQATVSGVTGFTDSATLTSLPTVGNLLVVAVGGDKNVGNATMPAGWTRQHNLFSTSVSLHVFTKISDGTEQTATVTKEFSTAGGRIWFGEISTGSNDWTLIGTGSTPTTEANVSSVTVTAGATSAADGFALMFASKDTHQLNENASWSAGWTEIQDAVGDTKAGLFIASSPSGTSGSTPSGTVTISGSAHIADQMQAAMIVVRASAGVVEPATSSNSFEGGADGVDITQANSGGPSGTALATPTLGATSTFRYATAAALRGSMGARVVAPATETVQGVLSSGAAGTVQSYRVGFIVRSFDAICHLFRMSGSGVSTMRTILNTNGTITFQTNDATLSTSSTTVTLNQKYWVRATINGTAGSMEWLDDAGNVLHSWSGTVTSSSIVSLQFGKLTSAPTVTVDYDDVAIRPSATPIPITALSTTPMFVGMTTADTGTTTNQMTLNVPAGVQNGDQLLLAISGSSSTVPQAISGWTALEMTESGAATDVFLYSRTANAEPSSYTVGVGGTTPTAVGAIVAYRNVASVRSDSGQTTSASTNTFTPGTPPGVATNDLFVSFVGARPDATGAGTITSPAGWNERLNLTGTGGGFSAQLVVADRFTLTPAAFTTPAGKLMQWAGVSAALIPSGAAPSTPTLGQRVVGFGEITTKTANATSVRLKISTDTAVTQNVVYTSAVTPDSLGNASHDYFSLGLTAGTKYYYRVAMTSGSEVLDSETLVGEFKTAPVGQTSFAFTFSACETTSSSVAYDAIAARTDDFNLHLGDLYYNDASGTDLANFRARMGAKLSEARHQKVFATRPNAFTPSDHDGSMNDTNTGVMDPTALANYNTAHREMIPAPHPANGVYYPYTWGRVLFLVLDTQTFASAVGDADNSSKTRLGATQKQWLKDQITNTNAPLIFLVQAQTWPGAASAGSDSWRGYSTERAEIVNHINAAGKNVAVLSGDMHAVAYDDGTNGLGLPTFSAAPLDNQSSIKGTYSGGTYPAAAGTTVQQYGRMVVTDNGTSISLAFEGLSADNTVRISATKNYSLTPPAITCSPTAIASAEAHGTTAVTQRVTSSPTAIGSAEAHGTTAVSQRVTLSPTSIASAEAVGSPSAAALAGATTVSPSGVASLEGVGSPSIVTRITILPSAIATAEAFGSTTLSMRVTSTPAAIGSAEAIGSPTVSTRVVLAPTGIASGEALGTPGSTTLIVLSPTGVGTAEAFGSPTIGAIAPPVTLAPTSVGSAEVFGTTEVSTRILLVPTAVASAQAFGTPAISLRITLLPGSIASAQAFGTTTAMTRIGLSPTSIASAELVGTPAVTAVIDLSPLAIDSVEAVGEPASSITFQSLTAMPTGFDDGFVVGTPSVMQRITMLPTSIITAQVFGSPSVSSRVVLLPISIAPQLGVGSPLIATRITLTPSSIASAEAPGSPSLVSRITLVPNGVGTAEAVGLPTLAMRVMLTPAGIASLEAVGSPSAAGLNTLTPTSIISAEAFGTLTTTQRVTMSPSGVVTQENFGSPSVLGLNTTLPTSIASGQAFGTAAVTTRITINPVSINTAQAFGTPALSARITMLPTSIISAQVFGTPVVSQRITMRPSSIASGESLGTPQALPGAVRMSPASIASLQALGVPNASLSFAPIELTPEGIASAEQFGLPELLDLLTVIPDSVDSREVFGLPSASFDWSTVPDIVMIASLLARDAKAVLSRRRKIAKLAPRGNLAILRRRPKEVQL